MRNNPSKRQRMYFFFSNLLFCIFLLYWSVHRGNTKKLFSVMRKIYSQISLKKIGNLFLCCWYRNPQCREKIKSIYKNLKKFRCTGVFFNRIGFEFASINQNCQKLITQKASSHMMHNYASWSSLWDCFSKLVSTFLCVFLSRWVLSKNTVILLKSTR